MTLRIAFIYCWGLTLVGCPVDRLFGSDSDSDDDNDVARKPAKRAPSPPPAKRAKTAKGKSARHKEEAAPRRSRHESGELCWDVPSSTPGYDCID